MNYQAYASLTPPNADVIYDRGQGVPLLNTTNMTIQDVFRTPFLFIQEHRQNYKNQAELALKGVASNSELSKLFFSDVNIKRLQKKIREAVFERTKGQFRLDVDQDATKVLIAMRAVYMEYGRFLPKETVRQVKRLNLKVVDEILPGMITEIKQEYGYLKEINKPLTPIMRPMNVNNAGRRTLPSVTTALGI